MWATRQTYSFSVTMALLLVVSLYPLFTELKR